MEYSDCNKLKKLYTEIIEIACNAKEADNMETKVDYLLILFRKVTECLEFSPSRIKLSTLHKNLYL